MRCDNGVVCEGVIVVMLHTGLSHVTKLDDSLLPRAEALHDFTAGGGQRLSFKVSERMNTYIYSITASIFTSEYVQM